MFVGGRYNLEEPLPSLYATALIRKRTMKLNVIAYLKHYFYFELLLRMFLLLLHGIGSGHRQSFALSAEEREGRDGLQSRQL